VFVLQSLL